MVSWPDPGAAPTVTAAGTAAQSQSPAAPSAVLTAAPCTTNPQPQTVAPAAAPAGAPAPAPAQWPRQQQRQQLQQQVALQAPTVGGAIHQWHQGCLVELCMHLCCLQSHSTGDTSSLSPDLALIRVPAAAACLPLSPRFPPQGARPSLRHCGQPHRGALPAARAHHWCDRPPGRHPGHLEHCARGGAAAPAGEDRPGGQGCLSGEAAGTGVGGWVAAGAGSSAGAICVRESVLLLLVVVMGMLWRGKMRGVGSRKSLQLGEGGGHGLT
jgi:hypothetical protein